VTVFATFVVERTPLAAAELTAAVLSLFDSVMVVDLSTPFHAVEEAVVMRT
jgi:predicted phosphoribosyltransferase